MSVKKKTDSKAKTIGFDPSNDFTQKDDQVEYVIKKYVKKGFESLSLEELAVTVVTNDFGNRFKKITGMEWSTPVQMKVIERLRRCNFDIKWMTRTGTLPADDTEFSSDVYFGLIKQGDIDKVIEYMRKYKEDVIDAVDSKKKTGLHIAAENGHTTVVDVMINSEFSLSARDKLLRIPLHWAAIGDHDGCVDLLLKAGSDQFQKDSIGRTPFHYAATGGKSTLLILMAAQDPEIVHVTDDHGRTALHYAIFNQNAKQVSIVRTLLELKSDINAVDEEGKTALHHASESGKSRVIPILIQNGASLVKKAQYPEGSRTPLQCAANDKIRELILLYSDPDYDAKKEDRAHLSNLKPVKEYNQETLKKPSSKAFDTFHPGTIGTRADIDNQKIVQPTQRKSKSKHREEQKGYYDELEVLEDKGILPFNLRNHRIKLIQLLKKVQEYGINHNLHKNKKYIFSGSWMEKIDDLTDLMADMVQ